MIYSTIMQQGTKPTRSCSPCDSDTSGISSEGSEAALIDMMVGGSLIYGKWCDLKMVIGSLIWQNGSNLYCVKFGVLWW